MSAASLQMGRWAGPDRLPRSRIVLYAWWAPPEFEPAGALPEGAAPGAGDPGCSPGSPDRVRKPAPVQ